MVDPALRERSWPRDLLEEHAWLDKEDFAQGRARAARTGPLGAEVAIYIGWLREGALGAALVGGAFVLG